MADKTQDQARYRNRAPGKRNAAASRGAWPQPVSPRSHGSHHWPVQAVCRGRRLAQTETEKYGFGQSRLGEKPDETITPEMKKMNWRAPALAGGSRDRPVAGDANHLERRGRVYNWLSEQEKLKPCYRQDEKAGWVLLPISSSNGVPKAERMGIRLPTEAEWEFACRAGAATQFSFGDDPAMLEQFAWWGSQRDESAVAHPSPVATKQANPFGLFDMHGNAAEFCQDFGKIYYAASPSADPPGPSDGGPARRAAATMPMARPIAAVRFAFGRPCCRGVGTPAFAWRARCRCPSPRFVTRASWPNG